MVLACFQPEKPEDCGGAAGPFFEREQERARVWRCGKSRPIVIEVHGITCSHGRFGRRLPYSRVRLVPHGGASRPCGSDLESLLGAGRAHISGILKGIPVAHILLQLPVSGTIIAATLRP
jgi:hypothetical protein